MYYKCVPGILEMKYIVCVKIYFCRLVTLAIPIRKNLEGLIKLHSNRWERKKAALVFICFCYNLVKEAFYPTLLLGQLEMHLLTLAKNVIDSIQLEHNERRFSPFSKKKNLVSSKKNCAFFFGPCI